MARPLRIEYEGAIYHVTSRGNERQEIFADDKDRQHFVYLLKENADFLKMEVISYCLMSNHFHLLICTKDANLSRCMQRLNTSYTRYFNNRHKRVGHLFQGRYKAIVVGSDEYFLTLSRYIHLNPVKVKKNINKSRKEKELMLLGYRWSSFAEILDPGKRSQYFNCVRLLDSFGGDTNAAREHYKDFVFEGLDAKVKNPMEDVKVQLILGDDKFIEWIKEKFIKGRDKTAHPHLKGMETPIESATIADSVAKVYGVKKADILNANSRHREARQVLIELSYRANIRKKSLVELGKELGGITGSAIAQVHKRVLLKLVSNKELKSKIENFIKQLSIVEA